MFEAIRVRGAVWERREGFGLPGITSLSALGSAELELVSVLNESEVGDSISNPLDFFALGRGVAIGDDRTFVTVADEL